MLPSGRCSAARISAGGHLSARISAENAGVSPFLSNSVRQKITFPQQSKSVCANFVARNATLGTYLVVFERVQLENDWSDFLC